MTFAEYTAKSVADARVLVQVDIGSANSQWVNCGAGLWYVNFDGLYPEVDASLLDGFTAQTFTDIGSVTVDGISLVKAASVAALTDYTGAYYYDSTASELFVCLPAYSDPALHNIILGVIHGFSFDEFTPTGADTLYEGRLRGSPAFAQSRDPLYFGKLQYNISGITLVNADGAFDTFAVDNDVYGNEARFFFGYRQLDITDYLRIYTGTMQAISAGEEEAQLSVSDRRMQLTKPILYACTDMNALDAIADILSQSYGYQYTDTYYDTTAWEAARALAPLVTMDTREESPVINVIEEICGTVFGLFKIDADNRFSFKIIDTTASAMTTIVAADILSRHIINYDPAEVISSVRVGYDKVWDLGYVSPYTFHTDTSRESAIWLKYKTYRQETFYTLLTTLADAQAFATKILDYAQDVHGLGTIDVPMAYYAYGVGDIVNAVLDRETTTMLGTKKVEIISKQYNLAQGTITFGYRIV